MAPGGSVEHSVDHAARPVFVHRRDRDPRLYDLAPRPTTRRAPHGWTEAGVWRHKMSALLTLVTALRLAPREAADGDETARRRDLRRTAVARVYELTTELLAHPMTGQAPTEQFPRAEGA